MIYYTIIESYQISSLKFQKTFKSKKNRKKEAPFILYLR